MKNRLITTFVVLVGLILIASGFLISNQKTEGGSDLTNATIDNSPDIKPDEQIPSSSDSIEQVKESTNPKILTNADMTATLSTINKDEYLEAMNLKDGEEEKYLFESYNVGANPGEKIYPLKDLPGVKIENNCLHLPTNTETKILCNIVATSDDEASVKTYGLYNYLPEVNSYVYTVSYYEGSQVFLLSKKTNEQHEINSKHILFSPSKKYLISFSPENDSYSLGGFQIFKNDGGTPRLMISNDAAKNSTWFLDNPYWKSDNEIYFRYKTGANDLVFQKMVLIEL